jgi:hypothetical protein
MKNQQRGLFLCELHGGIINETGKHTRQRDKENDPDPQLAGSFNANTIISHLPAS